MVRVTKRFKLFIQTMCVLGFTALIVHVKGENQLKNDTALFSKVEIKAEKQDSLKGWLNKRKIISGPKNIVGPFVKVNTQFLRKRIGDLQYAKNIRNGTIKKSKTLSISESDSILDFSGLLNQKIKIVIDTSLDFFGVLCFSGHLENNKDAIATFGINNEGKINGHIFDFNEHRIEIHTINNDTIVGIEKPYFEPGENFKY
jgi:hypothetical protein